MMVVMVSVLLVIVIVIVIVMLMLILVIVIIVIVMLDFLDPGGGGGDLVELEHTRVEDLFEVEIAVVAFQDACLGLERPHDGADAAQLFGCDFRHLVEHDHVAEFNLLDDQALDVFFVEMRFAQILTAGEFALHTHRVDNGHHAVEHRDPVLHEFETQRR